MPCGLLAASRLVAPLQSPAWSLACTFGGLAFSLVTTNLPVVAAENAGQSITTLLDQTCFDCNDAGTHKGGLDLTKLLLLYALAFQTYLWTLGMARPDRDRMGFASTPLGFFICEIPLIVAVVSCIWMRWLVPTLPHSPAKGS